MSSDKCLKFDLKLIFMQLLLEREHELFSHLKETVLYVV